MKKRILIALTIALAMGAQAENYENPSEFTNPYEARYLTVGYGKFEYWFLSRDGMGRYPTFGDVNKVRPKIGNGKNKETSLCIGYDFRKSSIKNKQGRMVRISHEESSGLDYELCIWGYYGNNEHFIGGFNPKFPRQGLVCLFKQEHFQNHKENFNIKLDTCNSVYLVIEFVCKEKGFYYFSDIDIAFYRYPFKKKDCVFNEKYFYDEYPMYPVDTATSIDEIELNTYVSNGVFYTNEPTSVCIYNMTGVLINVTTLDLTNLKSGVYIAKVNNKTIKFVR